MAAEPVAKIKLHWLNGSRAQRIVWLLEELEVPYELEIFHRQENLLAPPELDKIHPLGKSPVVTVTPPGTAEPIVLAESGFIVQYLCDHFGQDKTLVPKRWKEGQEGRIGGETEEWMRYQYTLYYAEGSFMTWLILYMVVSAIKGPNVPWLVRLITRAIADRIIALLIFPNVKKHLAFLESQLTDSPEGWKYLCGAHLTAADILLAYGLLAGKTGFDEMGKWEKGSAEATFPKLFAYIHMLEAEPGWQKAAEKIRQIEGKYTITPQGN